MSRVTTATTASPAPARGYRLPGLRRCRVDASLTQEELARAAGLTRVTVTRLEGGLQRANPSTIRALAAALRVRPHQLRGASPGAGAQRGARPLDGAAAPPGAGERQLVKEGRG